MMADTLPRPPNSSKTTANTTIQCSILNEPPNMILLLIIIRWCVRPMQPRTLQHYRQRCRYRQAFEAKKHQKLPIKIPVPGTDAEKCHGCVNLSPHQPEKQTPGLDQPAPAPDCRPRLNSAPEYAHAGEFHRVPSAQIGGSVTPGQANVTPSPRQ